MTKNRYLTTDYDCQVDWQWPEYVTDYGKALSTHQTSDGIVEHMSQCLIAPFPEKVQIKSRLVDSFLPRLSKTMLPLSPKPGQDHPEAQQLRKPDNTSSSQGLRFSQFKKKNFSGFSLPLLTIEGPLTKMVRAYQDLPKGALNNQIHFLCLTVFFLSYRICRGCRLLKKRSHFPKGRDSQHETPYLARRGNVCKQILKDSSQCLSTLGFSLASRSYPPGQCMAAQAKLQAPEKRSRHPSQRMKHVSCLCLSS